MSRPPSPLEALLGVPLRCRASDRPIPRREFGCHTPAFRARYSRLAARKWQPPSLTELRKSGTEKLLIKWSWVRVPAGSLEQIPVMFEHIQHGAGNEAKGLDDACYPAQGTWNCALGSLAGASFWRMPFRWGSSWANRATDRLRAYRFHRLLNAGNFIHRYHSYEAGLRHDQLPHYST
jgi:hypothetical protein